MNDKVITIPVVALRGMTILPGMVAHFDVSREKSMKAIEEAMIGGRECFSDYPAKYISRRARNRRFISNRRDCKGKAGH